MEQRKKRALVVLIPTVMLLAQACAAPRRQNPVPEELVNSARIAGVPLARMWGDQVPVDIEARVKLLATQTRASQGSRDSRQYSLLTISGGGPDGAYGAGLLKGWTEAGTRPDFSIVTGVSTGALLAPFAFLGSRYDDDAEALYTSTSSSDIARRRGTLRGLLSDAMADTSPMKERIAEVIDDQMIRDISAEYAKGRRLLIGTTNLDSRRPVIWNIGAIATVGDEAAERLIEEILLASASIPGLFPPVHISVEADGQTYEEIHVDGGTTTQVFLYPPGLNLGEAATRMGVGRGRTMYVIRNSIIEPRWTFVDSRLLPIAKASISTLISSQGVGDLYRMFLQAERYQIDFNLAYIPSDFSVVPGEDFDPKYMRALFQLGYERARSGYPWAKAPPGVGSGEKQ